MKRVILLSALMMLSTGAMAENVTISDPDEIDIGDHKTECIYTSGDKTYSYVTSGECRYSKTFDVVEGE